MKLLKRSAKDSLNSKQKTRFLTPPGSQREMKRVAMVALDLVKRAVKMNLSSTSPERMARRFFSSYIVKSRTYQT